MFAAAYSNVSVLSRICWFLPHRFFFFFLNRIKEHINDPCVCQSCTPGDLITGTPSPIRDYITPLNGLLLLIINDMVSFPLTACNSCAVASWHSSELIRNNVKKTWNRRSVSKKVRNKNREFLKFGSLRASQYSGP